MKFDGHIHTPFCPHGSPDSLKSYAERAIVLGFKEISFTEHAPLPEGFSDPVPEKDSALPIDQLEPYLHAIHDVKKAYSKEIRINLGFEVDYIEGFESATSKFLNDYGEAMDDSILSVHFLLNNGSYYCLDYSEEGFEEICRAAGSIEQTYDLYYRTVEKSILSDLGTWKPKRIGHITLAHKFQKLFPAPGQDLERISSLLDLIKAGGYELDYNTAGLRKKHCQNAYPYDSAARLAIEKGIPLVFGSDAHIASDIGADYAYYQKLITGLPLSSE
ncbi:histidinol-phosphatase HisJ [Metabacillus sp. KIGAM252]|uniref:Histidinol-phosphatase n=1 Tax=Metabacillus flavus TaxID=2823519 RepID=A0ABS5LGZ7_9BACI|nr:histidinol-phosphatase HisJ [Metabacillus flavus]